ncbi:trypsin-like serine protease [Actinospica sp. MGRD01-02]|uniref:Serine protease n=1 Tax=Actinospica acidithermotolerans TaxID=2828514 RepID=A0A941IIC2_9ACTN|nr:trypsin-like serine protease [Actinospica acidithermotolerans]MBR7829485.1 trypsin-like serine protease [Actinospica acidithermotolerans]
MTTIDLPPHPDPDPDDHDLDAGPDHDFADPNRPTPSAPQFQPAPPVPENALPQAIFPQYPLAVVDHPSASPLWRNVGRIESAAGSTSSGMLVYTGESVGIVTCAHALYKNDTLIYGAFSPAYGSTDPSIASIYFEVQDMLVCPDYSGPGDHPNDWIVIRVNDLPDGLDVATMPRLLPIAFAEVNGRDVRVTGYPKPANVMKYAVAPAISAGNNTHLVGYKASTDSGSSGGPVILESTVGTARPRLVAIHTGSDDATQPTFNEGVLLTAPIVDQMIRFLDAN